MLKQIIKEILTSELTGGNTTLKSNLDSKFIGQTCMIRTYSAGVHFGILAEREKECCLVKDSRRVWKWSGANCLSDLAVNGAAKLEDCRISAKMDAIILTDVIEIIPMSEKAMAMLSDKRWIYKNE